ncbi:DUF87 domain-containing protein [Romeria aff. gracilis LEGE 07310]|uniref:DUF87 domain-containing protein n=1 Tax=Vasconcelosia minhoensis LEGE 07310 TaxID=915328 RepID=A0A8J7A995_9CYAN|nr:DUF87 domain-containing protein [Romeria gracilis]MBE9078460.1 DUF87 domain-containing protein [Romeria aff. gracilis LEGE 07310]
MLAGSDKFLQALQTVDFSWTTHVKSIWNPPAFDISDLHGQARSQIITAAKQLQASNSAESPLGQVVGGDPGTGKTHLLSAIRQQAMAQGIGFVLVDMTDVRYFWETVLQGYISSLREDSEEGISQFQLKRIVKYLVDLTGRHNVSAEQISDLSAEVLNKGINAVLKAVSEKDRNATSQYQDVIRALLLLNSDDFGFSDIGYSWLSGLEIEPSAKQQFGFKTALKTNLSEIVKGLSWILSLQSHWILALDQIDSIVAQHCYASGASTEESTVLEQQVSQSIIEGIGGGLMALHESTSKTLTIVSCLRITWDMLCKKVVRSFQDRFKVPIMLLPVSQQDIATRLIASRLQVAYQQYQLEPPYPTWPFHPDFFEAAQGQTPRKILQRCEQHRQRCLANAEITELRSFTRTEPKTVINHDFNSIEQKFQSIQKNLEISQAVEEGHEDDILGQWLQTAGECLIRENPTADSIDSLVDIDFPGGKNYPQLHARLRLVYRAEGDREKHLCLRALQRSHHAAYRTRLKAAMTTAGIDQALSFRRLMLIRTHDVPGGAATQRLTQEFSKAGGILAYPSSDQLRVIGALHQLKAQNLPDFESWLRQKRPVSQLAFMQETVSWFFDAATSSVTTHQNGSAQTTGLIETDFSADWPQKNEAPSSGRGASASSDREPEHRADSEAGLNGLPIGSRYFGSQVGDTVSIPLESLTKHTVVLAGSGTGKTVLVRRLVEEAALQGIPAIIIDCANDLSRMGDRWPTAPSIWTEQDRLKAERYHQQTNTVIWTPGREGGNPMNLDPLPNFSALSDNADELNQAIDMARDSLQDIVAPGRAASAKIKRGILRNALEYFAESGGGNLERLAEFLNELPAEASGNIANAPKRAREMADLLNAEIANNPLLRQCGAPLDPAVLLGINAPVTRLSIISLIGLPGLTQQQQFLNQLAMTLFTWIKKIPVLPGQPLRGLLVIDEAKDFIPSQQSTPCKSSLSRLVAQARKYGLGLIFATQAPKSIDHNIIANCSTQFYGRANSPSAINVVQDQLRQRGGDGHDIATLQKGQFYAVSETLTPPIKILTPLCFSYHPSSPLDESEVLARAAQSRPTLSL